MSSVPARKLPRAERRDQLLDTALAIVRDEGTDSLTLGHVAERAGVSKPIAYEHFGTRSGLLIALYERIDDRQVTALLEALERTPRRLEDVARVMSDAYMTCYLTVGPEAHAITAALSGDGQMEAFHQRLLDRYVDLYRDALAPYSALPPDTLHLRCVGLIGAAEAISRDMLRGRVDEAGARDALAALIVGGLAGG
ncbi:MAG: TetR/AcrR family transcriptional regulator [Inquilinus limosus]|uniref:TetR/AcrR family transcriptional regulator n=1 Tax=Inquilinus limosus TaxID=171674 RepID=A0A952FMF2_9PROT|nr:TetR/AcrR family transcriptional regulator [Inquilinus limosus]